jgi:hypothetical protein
MRAAAIAALAPILAIGCQRLEEPKRPLGAAHPATAASIAIAPATLEEFAREYKSWGRIDDENHFAPTLCTAIPGTARISESGDVATHGAKLYYLYAKDRDAYLARLGEGQPLGQVIVKESFKAAEPDPNEKTQTTIFGVGAVNGPAYAKKDGKLWRPGAPAELFVMFRRGDANDPTTDDGWLYATTSFDGKTIYSNGPVGSCMACHDKSADRLLFDVAKAAPFARNSAAGATPAAK